MGIRISLGFVLISLISHSQDLMGISSYNYLGVTGSLGKIFYKEVSSEAEGYKELENLYYENDLVFDTVGMKMDDNVLFFQRLYGNKHLSYYVIFVKTFSDKYEIYASYNRNKSDLYYGILLHKFDYKKLIHYDCKRETLEIHNGTFR